ncbi:MAG: flippase-like domain-containing protein [Kiritimatiellaeota bacterium]|nr:flippase-like domain-containing protein [Kiritimatiellota bacterium]
MTLSVFRKTRRILLTVSAFALAAFLLALVVRRTGDPQALAETLCDALSRPVWLAAGMALFSVSLMCGLLRWYTLLRALKLPVRFREALRLYATGHFFNVLGPGATGGDIVKATWIASKIPAGQRTTAVASIAAERLIGLMAMITFIFGVTLLRPDFFATSVALSSLRHMISVLFAGTVVFFILLTTVNWGKLAGKIKVREGGFSARILKIIVTVWRTFHICLTHPKASLTAFAFSLANHTTDTCVYFLLSRALLMNLTFRDMIVASPIANLTAAIPLTPGGVGLRENMLQTMLSAVGTPLDKSAALGFLMLATIIFWALVCGGIMVFMRNTIHPPMSSKNDITGNMGL